MASGAVSPTPTMAPFANENVHLPIDESHSSVVTLAMLAWMCSTTFQAADMSVV